MHLYGNSLKQVAITCLHGDSYEKAASLQIQAETNSKSKKGSWPNLLDADVLFLTRRWNCKWIAEKKVRNTLAMLHFVKK